MLDEAEMSDLLLSRDASEAESCIWIFKKYFSTTESRARTELFESSGINKSNGNFHFSQKRLKQYLCNQQYIAAKMYLFVQ